MGVVVSSDGATKQLLKIFALFLGGSVPVGGILHALSFKRLWMVEFVSPAMWLCLTAVLIAINGTNVVGEFTSQARQMQVLLLCMIYFLSVNFLSGTYFWQVVTRYTYG